MPEVKSFEPQEIGYGRVWITPSETRPDLIHVTIMADEYEDGYLCTCEGYRYRGHCKHIKHVMGIDDDLIDFQVSL